MKISKGGNCFIRSLASQEQRFPREILLVHIVDAIFGSMKTNYQRNVKLSTLHDRWECVMFASL